MNSFASVPHRLWRSVTAFLLALLLALPLVASPFPQDDDDETDSDYTPKRKAHWNYGIGASFLTVSRPLFGNNDETMTLDLTYTGFNILFGGWVPITAITPDLTLAFDVNFAAGYGFPTGNTAYDTPAVFGQVPAHVALQYRGLGRRTYAWGAAIGVGASGMFLASDAADGAFIAPSIYVDLIYAPKLFWTLRFQTNLTTPEFGSRNTFRAINITFIGGW
jgi:hypothetical protein